MPRYSSARRQQPAARGREQGQVLVWFLAFAATLAVVFAGVYSVGQVTSEKQKVVNAADAAAYSGALVEARALNLTSYTNRAVSGNEVLIAQLVSLDSWTSYIERATDTYQKEANALSAIPYIGVVFKALAVTLKAANTVAKPLSKVVDQTTSAVVQTWEALYRVWYTGAIVPAFTPPVMALAVNTTASGVLAQNVATQGGRIDAAPRLLHATEVGALNQLAWRNLITRYEKSGTHGTPSDNRKTAADLLLASLDDFSRERPGSKTPIIDTMFGTNSICVPPAVKIGSEKRGTTKLVGYDRWEAQDTVEFKVKFGVSPLCEWGKGQKGVAQGWGRATADANGSRGNRLRTDGNAGDLAYSANHANRGYTGIKELYDVRRDANGRPTTEESSVVVVAGKTGSAVRTNETLGFTNRPLEGPTGSPDLKAGFAKDQISAISQARVFFERPERNARDITGGTLFRADNAKEYASLYNPYWQARLTEPSAATRAVIYGAEGLNPGLALLAQ